MLAQPGVFHLTVEQKLEQILASHEITTNEQRSLVWLCLENSLNQQQENLANQVCEALRDGEIAIVR